MTDIFTNLDARLAAANEKLGDMSEVSPWGRHLGFRPTKLEKAHVWGVQEWREDLIGDPETGVIHGGVITSFLDNLCGMSCAVAMDKFRMVATLDLRIDYMRPADKGRDIIGEAECYHMTKSVAFCRAWAYHETRDKVIATLQGAFAITRPRKPGDGKGVL